MKKQLTLVSWSFQKNKALGDSYTLKLVIQNFIYLEIIEKTQDVPSNRIESH